MRARQRLRRASSLSALAVLALPVALGAPAQAGDLVSANFRLRGAVVAAGAQARALAPGPRYSGSGIAVGQLAAIGPSAASGSLTTLAPGFWPIVSGELPSLDLDGDGLPAFIDLDDDGDGLLDTVETGTGVFVSASDTGSDPNVFDTDGDGFSDGLEVSAGTDPNDSQSFPMVNVPALPAAGLLLLFAALCLGARVGLQHRQATRRSTS